MRLLINPIIYCLSVLIALILFLFFEIMIITIYPFYYICKKVMDHKYKWELNIIEEIDTLGELAGDLYKFISKMTTAIFWKKVFVR